MCKALWLGSQWAGQCIEENINFLSVISCWEVSEIVCYVSLVLRYKIPNCYSVGTKNKLKTSVKDNRQNFAPVSNRELTNRPLRLLLQRLSQEITTNNKREEGKEMSVLDSDPLNHRRKWSYLWTNNKLCEKSGTRETDPLQPPGMLSFSVGLFQSKSLFLCRINVHV